MANQTEKGSVLLQVMVLGIIVAFLAAGMAALLLFRGAATDRIETGSQGQRVDEGGLSLLLYSWNSASGGTGGVCTSLAGVYGCNPPNSCSCVCKPVSPSNPIVNVASSAGTWPTCNSAISLTINY